MLARRFGRLAARIGPRPLIIAGGLVYALGGTVLVATVEPTPNYATSMLPAWLLTGLGVALALPAAVERHRVQGLPPDRYALGSAVNQTMRQLGATFGVALVVSFIAGATAGDALAHFQRAWWMIIACGTLTSLVAVALPDPARRAAATGPVPAVAAAGGLTHGWMIASSDLDAARSPAWTSRVDDLRGAGADRLGCAVDRHAARRASAARRRRRSPGTSGRR